MAQDSDEQHDHDDVDDDDVEHDDRPTTKDQQVDRVGGDCLTVHMRVGYIGYDEVFAPSIMRCRHAVLQVAHPPTTGWPEGYTGYVVYDRLLCRIVNGVYLIKDDALDTARYYNEDEGAPQDMSPNGDALGLIYPEPPTRDKK